MKRFIYPMLIVLVMALVVLAFVAFQALRSPQQDALSAHLRYLYQSQGKAVSVVQIVPALHPERFTMENSGAVYGDSMYFQVDQHYTEPYRQITGQRPLPYPPAQVSCVLLDSGQGRSVLFVVLHENLYNAQWLAHDAKYPWQSAELQTQMAEIGCEFKAE
jgi:hypothetical protein